MSDQSYPDLSRLDEPEEKGKGKPLQDGSYPNLEEAADKGNIINDDPA